MTHDATGSARGLMALAIDWWHDARTCWRQLNELDRLSGPELDRIASDVGLSTVDLLRLAAKPDGLAELLTRRLEALRLDPEAIRALAPLLLRDLQRTCVLCNERARCQADMDEQTNPPGWESYCPNSGTLRTLLPR